MTRATNSQAVNTTAKGYAGESPGAKNCEIDVDNAIPSTGFELDPGPYLNALQQAEVGLVGPGGLRAVSKGFIISDTIKHSVNTESILSFKFRGTFPIWQ